MFRRWAEARMYRRSMQIAVAELRRAARTANALEKLGCLEVAERRLEDARWLRPERGERLATGLEEIARGRERVLLKEARPAVARLLDAAEKDVPEKAEALGAAGALLCFLNHYLPDDREVEALSGRFLRLGGQQPAYRPLTPLSEMYHRPEGGAGCGTVIGGLLVVSGIVYWLALMLA